MLGCATSGIRQLKATANARKETKKTKKKESRLSVDLLMRALPSSQGPLVTFTLRGKVPTEPGAVTALNLVRVASKGLISLASSCLSL